MMYINKENKTLFNEIMDLLFNRNVIVVYINKHYKTLQNAMMGLLFNRNISVI